MRTARRLIVTLLLAGQLFWIAVSLYESAITLLGRLRRSPAAIRPEPPIPVPRVAAVVCARNEEAVVRTIVTGLAAQDYPRDHYEVFVAAHNCTDDTASVAARTGAHIIELQTPRPGKALAINAALDVIGPDWDLVGIFDADSRVPPGLLATVTAAWDGRSILQVETVPHDVGDWVGSGYGLGRRARNLFWWRPREALGMGTTISGTGYFASPALLRELLADTRTVTEDLEATARLYARGGRVAYTSSTYVQVEEAHSLPASMRQRLRWVRGHLSVVRWYWPGLARRGLKGDTGAVDMAVYLISPTRMLTRLAVSGALVLSVFRAPGALPAPLVALAFGGEWGLPVGIAIRERLISPTPRGLALAFRHSVLSLLWFPIGLWGLVSLRDSSWHPTPRVASSADPDGAVRAS